MMIHDVNDDPILQKPGQESSTSSKYTSNIGGSWHTDNHARAEIGHKIKELHTMMIYDVREDPILQVPGKEPSTSSK